MTGVDGVGAFGCVGAIGAHLAHEAAWRGVEERVLALLRGRPVACLGGLGADNGDDREERAERGQGAHDQLQEVGGSVPA